MKYKIMSIVFIVLMMIGFSITFWTLEKNSTDEGNQCSEKLYETLTALKSSPDAYDVITEVARVEKFSCSEYLEFFENMGNWGNQKK